MNGNKKVIIVLILVLASFLPRNNLFAREEKLPGKIQNEDVLLVQWKNHPRFDKTFLMQESEETQIPKKVVLKSLLIPGWGEKGLGKNNRAVFFFSSEITLLTGYSIMKKMYKIRRDDYRNFAVQHAGINRFRKNYLYYVNIENFNNIYEYNTQQLRYRQIDDVYPETQDYFWQWDRESNRRRYEDMRIKADTMKRNASFVMSAIILNHIISAIDALYFLRASVSQDQEFSQLSLSVKIPLK